MLKTLIITGGSRGIGKKTIEHFQAQGWQAINLSRSPCTLPDVTNFYLDLAKAQEIQKQSEHLQALIKEATQVCLVHNAAFYKMDEVTSLSLDQLQCTLETNVISPAILNKIFIPHMQAGSSIIYIGSTLAEKGVPGNASYIMSKHAVIGLMRATCQDLMNQAIHTCCICPGLVDTQLLKETMDEKVIRQLLDTKIIGKRLIEPHEIANIIYFCATSATLNGAIFHANLGQVAD